MSSSRVNVLGAWARRAGVRAPADVRGTSAIHGRRGRYGLAADGLVLKNGVPRNPLHAALLLEMGEVRLPGVYAPLERVLGLLARVARWRGVDGELERRYL